MIRLTWELVSQQPSTKPFIAYQSISQYLLQNSDIGTKHIKQKSVYIDRQDNLDMKEVMTEKISVHTCLKSTAVALQ